MAEAYLEVEEYLWFYEAIQGNVNIAGLVFDDILEEEIAFPDEDVLFVYSEMIDETFGIVETFTPYHQAFVGETLTFAEWFGTPLRVRQSIVNLITTWTPTPAMIANVHLDVLHGVDIYWEEVSSELQCASTYANAVPYYWEWIYESLDIDMTEPQPNPPLYLVLKLVTNDLVNMRHIVEQEYLFNSKCLEELFVWPEMTWGWGKDVESSLGNTDTIREIIGKLADDVIMFKDNETLRLSVKHLIDDRVFCFDLVESDDANGLLCIEESFGFSDYSADIIGHLISERLRMFTDTPVAVRLLNNIIADGVQADDSSSVAGYCVLLVDDAVTITDGVVSFLASDNNIHELFKLLDATGVLATVSGLATESLTFVDIQDLYLGFVIDDSFGAEDAALEAWAAEVLLAEGFDISDIIT